MSRDDFIKNEFRTATKALLVDGDFSDLNYSKWLKIIARHLSNVNHRAIFLAQIDELKQEFATRPIPFVLLQSLQSIYFANEITHTAASIYLMDKVLNLAAEYKTFDFGTIQAHAERKRNNIDSIKNLSDSELRFL